MNETEGWSHEQNISFPTNVMCVWSKDSVLLLMITSYPKPIFNTALINIKKISHRFQGQTDLMTPWHKQSKVC